MSLLLLFGGVGGGTLASGSSGPFGSTVSIEFSPTTGPLEPPVWVDITDLVRHADGVTISRGRSSELDQFQAGTASFTLDNRDRIFDPTYTAGPYYGNLKVLRRFRIRVAYASTVYSLFSGFIQGWPQTYEVSNSDAVVPVELVDGFALLSLANLFDAGTFTLDSDTLGILDEDRLGISGDDGLVSVRSGERAAQILDSVGYPNDCDPGQSEVTVESPTGSLLSYIQQLERSEDGFFFIDGTGAAVFLDRDARQDLTRISTSQATFDDQGTVPYAGVSFSHDLERLYNDVRRTGVSGVEQAAEDDASIVDYFRRSNADDLLVTDDAVALGLATIFLDRYSQPQQRVPAIQVKPGRNPAVLFPAVLARELLDRVTVTRSPLAVGTANESELLVEGIRHQFDAVSWETEFQLSPGFVTEWFTLDSDDLGILDEDLIGA